MDRTPGDRIFLTGAPEAEALDWNEAHLLSDFTIGQRQVSSATQHPTPTESWQPPKWRDVPISRTKPGRKSTSGLGKRRQREESPRKNISFSFGMPSLPLATPQPGFLEHSIALLSDLASSQIMPTTGLEDSTVSGGQNATISFGSDTSDTSYAISDSFLLGGTAGTGLAQSIGPVTDLKDIPNASHIQAIIPQTLTVNLLAAVITAFQPRTMPLRKSNRTMEIVELLLGDETRAGFSVTFWLVPVDESQKRKVSVEELALRETLMSLRAGHVVAVGSVALSCFKSVVHGQSLNRRTMRNSTWVARIGEDAKVDEVLVGKLTRVRDWAGMFVGGDVGKAKVPKTNYLGILEEMEEHLPPDTQDT